MRRMTNRMENQKTDAQIIAQLTADQLRDIADAMDNPNLRAGYATVDEYIERVVNI